MNAVLQLDGIEKRFPGPRRGTVVHALNGVSLVLPEGDTLAVVGESGSGKSTLGRIAVRLDRPSAGRVAFGGDDITRAPLGELRGRRAEMQMIFQDPWATINPRFSVGSAIEEPLRLHTRLEASARRERVRAIAAEVRLDDRLLERPPAHLSGGQLQRVAIARALVLRPRLVVLDEPTSSLDLSVRAEILDLLDRLRRESGTSYLFITHDLGTVRLLADRTLVLYLGSVMEIGASARVFASPRHPYTRALLSAELSTDPSHRRARLQLQGEIPSPLALPPGCPFAGRCPHVIERCRAEKPTLRTIDDREVACHRAEDLA